MAWSLRIGIALFTRAFGSLCQLGLAIVLGRLLGASGVGVYFVFIAWVRIFENLLSLGLPQYAMRLVSQYHVYNYGRSGSRMLIKSTVAIAGVTAVATALTGLMLTIRPDWLPLSEAPILLLYAVLAGGLLAALRVASEALKGWDRPNIALAFEYTAVPLILSLLLLSLAYVKQPIHLQLVGLSYVIITSIVLASAITANLLQWRGSSHAENLVLFEGESVRALVPAFWGFNVLNGVYTSMPFVFLPFFASSTQIGLFGTAHRLMALGGVIMAALASWFGPRFARHAATQDSKALALDLRQSQIVSALAFAPLFLMFSVAGRQTLDLFGRDFRGGVVFLLILASGQMANAALGLASEFLNMAGGQGVEFRNILVATIGLAAATLAMGAMWGAIGVAFAYAAVLILRKTASYMAATRLTRRIASFGAGGTVPAEVS